MDDNATARQVVLREVAAADVLPLLAQAAGDDVQGLGLAEIVNGCRFFAIEQGGAVLLGYALREAGRELWIQAAGGVPGPLDMSLVGLAAIEQQAAGFESVGFQTRRRGLVRKAIKAGYEIDGFILRKKIA